MWSPEKPAFRRAMVKEPSEKSLGGFTGTKSSTDIKRNGASDDLSRLTSKQRGLKSSGPVVHRSLGPEDGLPFKVEETFKLRHRKLPEPGVKRVPTTVTPAALRKTQHKKPPAMPVPVTEPTGTDPALVPTIERASTAHHTPKQPSEDITPKQDDGDRNWSSSISPTTVAEANRVLYSRLEALLARQGDQDAGEDDYFSSDSDYDSGSEPDSIS
ncbi:hypothetical protein JADG_007460 [Aureobasidium aubasidani]|nr:hypothetical protein JADG_007460 [Aureobasidium pullulans]